MNTELDLGSLRAKKARFSERIGKTGFQVIYISALVLLVGGIGCFIIGSLSRIGYFSTAVSLSLFMFVLWYWRDLGEIKPNKNPTQLHDVVSAKLLALLKKPVSPKTAWVAANQMWPAKFLVSHLLLHPEDISDGLSTNEQDMVIIWQTAIKLMKSQNATELDSGTLAAAIMLTSSSARKFMQQINLQDQEVMEVYTWLERLLKYLHQPKPNFGGIGRDWAMGYATTLERYSSNISRTIEASGGYDHFLAHTDVLNSVITNLDRGTPVSIVGQPGTGKTSLIYGLAERLLEGKDTHLRYYQIISLNASLIISSGSGELEKLMLQLFGEAMHAGNIILFLDEAQLFFGGGVGAFNMSQLLLPVIQSHRIKIIAAFTPNTWQQLRATNETLAAGFASVTINEPSMEDTMKILEDTALLLQGRDNVVISYQAVREAYRLSGMYMQELAYPGKAISALEQAIPYATNGLLTEVSVQKSMETTRGVKVTAAQAPEADVLLHLEDHIHARMINQSRAVNVISAALRRGRAGVSNPKRPLGSFLFLGPTGVGKTELARSLAAVYFKSEAAMIRLDMTEYQRPDDVARLLSPGTQGEKGLLMSIREQPFSVVLFDEIEKANPQILNLLLQLLDEGQLTDEAGKPASFRSSIIIATSNAGSADITAQVSAGKSIEDFERPLIDKLIASGLFKPELINRFDEIVLFRPLNLAELTQVAQLMVGEVNKTLSTQNISVKLTEGALEMLVKAGYDPTFGARPMRRIIQKTVEDAVAMKILAQEAHPGSVITLDTPELQEHLNKKS
jgi:ATP-dependent Clp protease ATP-binding subunit ClpC